MAGLRGVGLCDLVIDRLAFVASFWVPFYSRSILLIMAFMNAPHLDEQKGTKKNQLLIGNWQLNNFSIDNGRKLYFT